MERPEDAPAAFQAAWNGHVMAALGRLFHRDATFVNRFGHYVRGVEEIVALHVPIHETIYRDSVLLNELIDVSHIADGGGSHSFLESPLGRRRPSGRTSHRRYADPRSADTRGRQMAYPSARERDPCKPADRTSDPARLALQRVEYPTLNHVLAHLRRRQ